MGDFPNRSTQFKKGEVNNPNGRPRGSKNIKTILRELLEVPKTIRSEDGVETKISRLENICIELIKMAEHGDLASIDRVFDRLEGKAEQSTKVVAEVSNTGVGVTKEEAEEIYKAIEASI